MQRMATFQNNESRFFPHFQNSFCNHQYQGYKQNNPWINKMEKSKDESLQQIEGNKKCLKRNRPSSDEEEFEQTYRPLFAKKKNYHKDQKSLKKIISNESTYVDNVEGYAKT